MLKRKRLIVSLLCVKTSNSSLSGTRSAAGWTGSDPDWFDGPDGSYTTRLSVASVDVPRKVIFGFIFVIYVRSSHAFLLSFASFNISCWELGGCCCCCCFFITRNRWSAWKQMVKINSVHYLRWHFHLLFCFLSPLRCNSSEAGGLDNDVPSEEIHLQFCFFPALSKIKTKSMTVLSFHSSSLSMF